MLMTAVKNELSGPMLVTNVRNQSGISNRTLVCCGG